MIRPIFIAAAFAITSTVVTTFSSPAIASGGGGYDTGSFSQQRIDQLYELGKAYYKAPQADGKRLEYCIKTNDGLKKLSRSSVRPFKRGAAATFVNSLYSCQDPSLKISDAVADDQGDAILHYLNKRFKLRLAGS